MTNEIVLRSYRREELLAVLTASGFTPRRWWADGAVPRVTAQID